MHLHITESNIDSAIVTFCFAATVAMFAIFVLLA